MSDPTQWPLQKIREAYLDAVELYNTLHPLVPERNIGNDEVAGEIED